MVANKNKDLEKAYFGIRVWDFNAKEFTTHNLFGSSRVRDSIVIYRTRYCNMARDMDDAIAFCFGDVRGRVEYEFGISEVFTDDMQKTDVYTMYVVPNKELLYNMVNEFTMASIKRWKAKSTKLSRRVRSK